MLRKLLLMIVWACSRAEIITNNNVVDKESDCEGKRFENVTLTAYYPDYDSDNGYEDARGKRLQTLQDYLDGRETFVTIAMDSTLGIPYGAPVCIPELDEHFGRHLKFQARDSGSDLTGMGHSRADVCVRTEVDSYDNFVNRIVTLVFVTQ